MVRKDLKRFQRKADKTKTIFRCKSCGFYQETEGLSSIRICPHCRPIKKCVHGVYVTVECAECSKIYPNSRFMRVM